MLGDYIRPTMLSRLLLAPDSALRLSGDSSFNYINHTDVGDFIEAALQQDLSGSFNLASASNVCLREIADALCLNAKFGSHCYDSGQFDNSAATDFVAGLKRCSLDKVVEFAQRVRAGLLHFAPVRGG